jgi:hypothetical protein
MIAAHTTAGALLICLMAASQRLHRPVRVLLASVSLASKTMLANVASFTLVTVAFGLGAFAIVASPEAMPNQEGLTKCMQLHPERYCRIANGFPVEPLDKQAN